MCCSRLVGNVVGAEVHMASLGMCDFFIGGTSCGRLELVHSFESRVDDDLWHLAHDSLLFLNDSFRLFRDSDLVLAGLALFRRCGGSCALAARRSLGLYAGGIAGSPLPARGTQRLLHLGYRLAGARALALLAPLGRHGGVVFVASRSQSMSSVSSCGTGIVSRWKCRYNLMYGWVVVTIAGSKLSTAELGAVELSDVQKRWCFMGVVTGAA